MAWGSHVHPAHCCEEAALLGTLAPEARNLLSEGPWWVDRELVQQVSGLPLMRLTRSLSAATPCGALSTSSNNSGV